ncbi:54S ribosomal protein L12 [Mitosporidium daphniae]
MLIRVDRISTCLSRRVKHFTTAPSASFNLEKNPPAQSIDSIGGSPLVQQLVDSIEKLTLLETAALVKSLKARLNLPDVGFSPTQLGATQHLSTLGSGPLATEVESPAPAAPPTQTEFKIILQKVDPAAKAKIIREIKGILPGLNLVEAKTFVESVPKLVKEKLTSADAQKLKKTLEDLGATVSME